MTRGKGARGWAGDVSFGGGARQAAGWTGDVDDAPKKASIGWRSDVCESWPVRKGISRHVFAGMCAREEGPWTDRNMRTVFNGS